MEEDVDAECKAKEEIGELQIADAPENFPTFFGGNRHGLRHEIPPMFSRGRMISLAPEFHILGQRWQPLAAASEGGKFIRERRFASPEKPTSVAAFASGIRMNSQHRLPV